MQRFVHDHTYPNGPHCQGCEDYEKVQRESMERWVREWQPSDG